MTGMNPPLHPSSADLQLFLLGNLLPSRTRVVVRHLLTGCSSCRSEACRLVQDCAPLWPLPDVSERF